MPLSADPASVRMPPGARMQLAMYKGPAKTVCQKLQHWAICLFTWSRYSHIELVIDGRCYSASDRDGGVRGKDIALDSGHWDVFELPMVYQRRKSQALEWFRAHDGENYDWIGVIRLCPLLGRLPVRPRHHFCSKAIAEALGVAHAEDFSPQHLLDYLMEPSR